MITFSIITIFSILFISLKGGIINSEYKIYKTLDNYEINFIGEIQVSYFSETAQGDVEVVTSTDEIHSIKINGRKNGKYKFKIIDDEKEYSFEYYYDKNTKSVIFNKK